MKLKFDDLINLVLNEAAPTRPTSPAYRQRAAAAARRAQQNSPSVKPSVPSSVKPALKTALGAIGKGAIRTAAAAGGAALKAPGAIPGAVNTARDFFLGNNPLGMIQQGINKGIAAAAAAGAKLAEMYWTARDKQIAKSLGKRTENPKRGDLVNFDLGSETLGLIIPGKANLPSLKISKATAYQKQTIYDIPVPNNNNFNLIKMQAGAPSQSQVSLFYFLNETRIQGNRINLPEIANLINDGKLANTWLVSDKREASVEIFETARVLQLQNKNTAAAQTTSTPPAAAPATATAAAATPAAPTATTTAAAATPAAPTATTTAPTAATPTTPTAAATPPVLPRPGETFTYKERYTGRTTTYEILQVDSEKTYAIKIRV